MLKEIKSDIYHLLHPKMIFLLTSISKDSKPNVMTCAWATPVSEEPPIVIVCVEKSAYTAELIRQTKEFVINIPTKQLLKALWICGKTSGRNSDKFKKSGLKINDAKRVKAPLIEGCIGYIECKLWKTVEAGECYAFFGNVLHAEADEKYFKKDAWTKTSGIPFHLSGAKIVYFK
ncbi:MAG: flavin reductase family protein [Thermodesulfovibrionales bacterium]|nr:flavin reductase family protein [Thermodesulfovibrionales bacterium]